jgi:hypothetical protein
MITAEDKAYLCPHCGSPSMSIPLLAGGEYSCEVCGWSGQDPVLLPFGNPFGSSSETFNQFSAEVLKTYAEVAALPLGRLLVAWGFISRDKQGKPSTAELARYIKSMASGVIMAVIDERKKIERERVQTSVGPKS